MFRQYRYTMRAWLDMRGKSDDSDARQARLDQLRADDVFLPGQFTDSSMF